MDIEKLAEQYRQAADYWRKNNPNFPDVISSYEQAATALSTLQAENEKLRGELKSKVDLVFQQAKELDRRNLLLQEQEAEIEQARAERDAAVEDLQNHRKYKCDCCYYADKQSRFPCADCQSLISTYGVGWKWRGIQKED